MKNIQHLIDSDTSKGYNTNINGFKNIKEVEKPFLVKSIYGGDTISNKTLVNVLNHTETIYFTESVSI